NEPLIEPRFAKPNTITAHGSLAGLGLSIRDFLTDGSLARMCDEFSRMSGVPVWLRDLEGMVIVPSDHPANPGSGKGQPWRVVDGTTGAVRAYQMVGRGYQPDVELFVAPIRTSVGDIGSIAMPAAWERDDPVARRALERAVTILAATGVEHVEGMLILRERVEALDALFRLSSLLVKADDPDKLVQAALDLALDVLRLDAGTISVIDDGMGGPIAGNLGGDAALGLKHKAVRNLSPAWLAENAPLSTDGELRAAALRGEVVAVSDLQHDPRINDPSRPAAEGLVSLLTAGLVFAGRASGLIRLYSRTTREFTQSEKNLLRSIADHAAMALAHSRLRQLREQDAQMRRQLKLAADVQQRMLPRTLPSFDRFDLAARYVPSYQLGGDFYDVFERGGCLALAVGDVVGKGVPAALIMSAVRAGFRAFCSGGAPLDAVMSHLNGATARDTLESEFVTLWAATMDPRDLSVAYCSAGHDPSLVFSTGAGGVEVRELTTGGMALAIDPAQTYALGRQSLQPGDVLLAHTDGLSDATDFAGKRFTHQRIRETVIRLLAAEPAASASRIVEHLMWTVRQFAGVRLSTDDITLVVVRVRS
ncbi:MAG TPA: GAF domain-containing SpoIIE family protein phosphatase, partial [Phycisphaerales bacterium]|nr:GAF domain-containing SpoIIE family protein phosphatase [Phycisphaerales bacterium]